MLQETKEVLEDQLAGWRARSDKIHQLEKQSLLLKARIHGIEEVSAQGGRLTSPRGSAARLKRSSVCLIVRRGRRIRGASRSWWGRT